MSTPVSKYSYIPQGFNDRIKEAKAALEIRRTVDAKVRTFATWYFRLSAGGIPLFAITGIVGLVLGAKVVAIVGLVGTVLSIALLAHARFKYGAELREMQAQNTFEDYFKLAESKRWKDAREKTDGLLVKGERFPVPTQAAKDCFPDWEEKKIKELVSLMTGTAYLNQALQILEKANISREGKKQIEQIKDLSEKARIAFSVYPLQDKEKNFLKQLIGKPKMDLNGPLAVRYQLDGTGGDVGALMGE